MEVMKYFILIILLFLIQCSSLPFGKTKEGSGFERFPSTATGSPVKTGVLRPIHLGNNDWLSSSDLLSTMIVSNFTTSMEDKGIKTAKDSDIQDFAKKGKATDALQNLPKEVTQVMQGGKFSEKTLSLFKLLSEKGKLDSVAIPLLDTGFNEFQNGSPQRVGLILVKLSTGELYESGISKKYELGASSTANKDAMMSLGLQKNLTEATGVWNELQNKKDSNQTPTAVATIEDQKKESEEPKDWTPRVGMGVLVALWVLLP
jgi:hypothetical protein